MPRKASKPAVAEAVKLHSKIENETGGRKVIALSEKQLKKAYPQFSRDAIREVRRRMEE